MRARAISMSQSAAPQPVGADVGERLEADRLQGARGRRAEIPSSRRAGAAANTGLGEARPPLHGPADHDVLDH